ncbi:MAG: hypothetical protein KDD14_18650 [Saprospiraceae bacterium]|nr:hypothetical protein [Saprospiraceae bacterium]
MRNFIIFSGILITAVVDLCFSLKNLQIPFPVSALLFFVAGWLLNTPEIVLRHKFLWFYLPFGLFSAIGLVINWNIWFIILVAPLALWSGGYARGLFENRKIASIALVVTWVSGIWLLTLFLLPSMNTVLSR